MFHDSRMDKVRNETTYFWHILLWNWYVHKSHETEYNKYMHTQYTIIEVLYLIPNLLKLLVNITITS